MDENKAENNTVESGEVSGRPNRSDPIEKTEETAKDQPLSEQKNAPPETAPSEGQNAELQKNSPQESQKPEKKKPAGRKPAPNGQKQIKKGAATLFRLAEIAADPYPTLKKMPCPFWFLLLFPVSSYLCAFLHIAWDKISLFYLPAAFLVLYLFAGAAAGLLFTAADTAITFGISHLLKTGRKNTPQTLAGALCFPAMLTIPISVGGLLFRLLFGWGSILFVPVSLLLPLCFLLPFWTRYYKGKQLPAILSVFVSGLLRIGIAHIFLNMKL